MKTNNLRIGIFSGTFDPVHSGHISFALQSLKEAKLDLIYFMPERRPRYKPSVEHFAHRVAMLKQALKPYDKLRVLELEDPKFTVNVTLKRLERRFSNARLVLMIGSDVAYSLPDWEGVNQLLDSCELIVGIRGGQPERGLLQLFALSPMFPKSLTLIEAAKPHISSRHIRQALRHGLSTAGLLASVRRYSSSQWLYVSVSKE